MVGVCHIEKEIEVAFMIIYFSGTGNSRFAAEFLAKELQDEIINVGHLSVIKLWQSIKRYYVNWGGAY